MLTSNLRDQIRKVLAQDLDRISKARAVAQAIRGVGAYRWVGLYDVDTQLGIVSNIAWSGPGAPEHTSFPSTKGLTARAIATKKTVSVGDVASDPDYLPALVTTRSEIVVPVLDRMGNHVVGTIDVESERPAAFDHAAQTQLEECAIALRDFWQNRSASAKG